EKLVGGKLDLARKDDLEETGLGLGRHHRIERLAAEHADIGGLGLEGANGQGGSASDGDDMLAEHIKWSAMVCASNGSNFSEFDGGWHQPLPGGRVYHAAGQSQTESSVAGCRHPVTCVTGVMWRVGDELRNPFCIFASFLSLAVSSSF